MLVVLGPITIIVITDMIIFNHVRNSTKRVHTENMREGITRRAIVVSRRDVKLLKNMLFMFLLFAFGWTPIYIFRLINFPPGMLKVRIDFGLTLLPVYTLLMDMIILYYNNEELVNYILQRIRRGTLELAQRVAT
jgi:hypothetical protein